jgi:hypothetical protein
MTAVQYRDMQAWKVVGLAGIVGAAVVGVAAGARSAQRQRREFADHDPDELRAKLHQRLAAADGGNTRSG